LTEKWANPNESKIREDIMKPVCLILTASVMISSAVFAADPEHPVIKPIEGFVLRPAAKQKVENYGEYRFRRKDERGRDEFFVKKGKLWDLSYHKPAPGGSDDTGFSKIEIADNHVVAVKDAGGEIYRHYLGEVHFSVPRPDGGITYACLSASDGRYRLQIIDEKPLERNLEFTSADDMYSGIAEAGFVAVYGIHFDTDKADLKVGAAKTLEEVVKLLGSHPDLAVEIQGHTDSTGGDEHNLQLSRRRAETVKRYLLLYGVAEGRLRSTGFGEEKPVGDNATEEGRALNRRVELHRVD
jgi:outer membrane protein OmpA-like peptidoglycan-associated protein